MSYTFDYTQERCKQAADLICKRWTFQILRALVNPQGFIALQIIVEGISPRMLSERLKELEQYGIVSRQVYSTPPIRTQYTLTEKGRDLLPMIDAIQQWENIWLPED